MPKNSDDSSLTLEQLDALFETNRLAAAAVAEAVMAQEVATAISNISEINHIAIARIQADSAVASAKIGADAEVCATELVAHAEMAILRVQSSLSELQSDPVQLTSMVTEIGHNAREDISEGAEHTVNEIRSQAELALQQISVNAKNSINEIRCLAKQYTGRVAKNAEIAKRKLQEQQSTERSGDDITDEAEKAAEKVLIDAMSTTNSLRVNKNRTIEDINERTEAVLRDIRDATEKAETRIYGARDRALEMINDVLKKLLP